MEFLVAHHAQITLDATFKNHARFRFTFSCDLDDTRLRNEKFNHRRRLPRRRQQVNVTANLLEPPQAPRRAATHHIWMFAQIVQQRFGDAQRITQQMLARISAPPFDSFQNVRLRLLAKTVQFRDFPFLQAASSFSIESTPSLWLSAWIFFGPSPEISNIAIKPGGIEAFNSS